MNTAYDGVANPDFIYSLSGTRRDPGFGLPANAPPAVHLLANFNIDEAVGIEDVYDIEPFGRLG